MLRDRYAVPDAQGRLSFEHNLRRCHQGGQIRFRAHAIVFGQAWAWQKMMIIDKGGWLEFYLIPHGELVATLPLPLPETFNVNITKRGTFVAGDRKRLPHGVESKPKPYDASEK